MLLCAPGLLGIELEIVDSALERTVFPLTRYVSERDLFGLMGQEPTALWLGTPVPAVLEAIRLGIDQTCGINVFCFSDRPSYSGCGAGL